MEAVSGEGTASAPRRARRERSASESLLSIALGLEAFLVLFVTLAAFGLHALPPVVAFAGGAAFVVLLLADAALVRFPAGVALGWALQAALLATAFVLPVMLVIAAGFLAIWVYCFVRGRQIDRQKAAFLARLAAEGEPPAAAYPSPSAHPSPHPKESK